MVIAGTAPRRLPTGIRTERSPERIVYRGTLAGRPVNACLDWEKGSLKGMAGGHMADLRFDLDEGWVRGDYAHGHVDLRCEDGRVQGQWGKRTLDVEANMREFLENFYAY